MIGNNGKNRLKIALIILLMSISIGALSYSFGWVATNPRSVTSNYFMISEINFGLTSDVDSVSLGEVLPTLDKFGTLNEAFTFTVQNTSDSVQDYVVKLVDGEKISTISNKEIRYQLTVDDKLAGIYNLTTSGIIDSGKLEKDELHHYSIKIWLDYNSVQTNGVWDKIILVEAGDNNLDTSGANKPSLNDGMIPVYYDENNEVWKKADSYNIDKNYQWYDYDSLIWANVVTVKEDSREFYMNAKLGEEIKMDDINSMWVWIPRYKYTIFNDDFKDGLPKRINITFEKGVKSTSSITCITKFNSGRISSEMCSDTLNDGIIDGVSTYTHPAFTFGDKEVEGFWVAKFEAGSTDDESIVIKPNIESLGNVTISSLATRFRKMGIDGNIYGFNGGVTLNSDLTIDEDQNNVDIHMIKNSEWGAVAYLYHSKYGKYGNNSYSNSNREIYHNDSSITGYSTGSSDSKGGSYAYNVNELGTGASTTGNVYGIYDMKGGKGEMVMVNFQTIENQFVSNNGLNTDINIKYYDVYFNDSNLEVTRLGDGLKETKWYSDTQNISSSNVLYRGGLMSAYNDGIFGINTMSKDASINVGSRPVLIAESKVYITKW